jgi:hypothetical protein
MIASLYESVTLCMSPHLRETAEEREAEERLATRRERLLM